MAYITIENITNPTQTGVFDKIMEAIDYHIDKQFLANRITGGDYANVYLGSIQAALQQSMQYTLQAPLLELQASTAYTERVLKDKEAAKLGLDNVMKLSEAARDADPNFIYTPNYEEGV